MREGIIYEVQSILKENEDARADDMVLYVAYLNLKGYGNEVQKVLASRDFTGSARIGILILFPPSKLMIWK